MSAPEQKPMEEIWLGPYRVTSRIATGGMAEVYLGRRKVGSRFGPSVAVKRLLPQWAKDPRAVRMFLNEANITAQIRHPNVVRVLEVGEHEGAPFIALELLEGATLAELRAKAAEQAQRVPLNVALRVLVDACSGLDAAHRAVDDEGQRLCIVHRDFTPDNIHVGLDGRVKVIDFGIAKSALLQGLTEPGTLKGKYFYMSPEMIGGSAVDHRADVFAAGVMLYEQMCGQRPFTGSSVAEILARIAGGVPRKPRDVDPSVPPLLESICLTALARSPESRFQDLAALGHALESIPEAPPASPELLSAYVHELLPLEAKAQVERKALYAPGGPQARMVAPAASSAGAPSSPLKPLGKALGRGASAALAHARRHWKVVAIGLAVLVAAIVGAVWALRPEPPPAVRLAKAAKTQDPDARADLADLPADPRATFRQLARAGRLMADVHDDRAVLSFSEGFARRFPKRPEPRLLEAEASIHLRLGKRAERAIARAEALAPRDPRPDLLEGQLKVLEGDLDGGLSAYEAAAKKSPGNREADTQRVSLLIRLGRMKPAEAILARLLRRRYDPHLAAERAFIDLQQGQTKVAMARLRKALREDDKFAPAHYYLGAAFYREGELKKAEAQYLEADALDPSDSRALQALVDLYHQTGNAAALAKAEARLAARQKRP